MKTFVAELEEHNAMMNQLSACADAIETIANEQDCLIAISIFGTSRNILNAVQAARLKGMAVIGLTGRDGGELGKQVTHSVIVPSQVTAKIREAY